METLQRTANRGSISTGYDIDNSVKIEPANDEGLHFTPSSTTNTDTFTFSCWFKRTEISNQLNTLFGSYTDGSNHAIFRFKTDDTLELRFVTTGTGKIIVSDMLFRDTSAWYHMVLAVDTSIYPSTDRVKVYINGEQITLTGGYPNTNQDCIGINTASKAMNVGYISNFSDIEFAGYIAEAHHIDGSQLAPTDFGETDEDSGIWKPKAYTGSYGTNGFYLDFESSGSLGADSSGNGNDFTLNNITSADQATDTPTNNFATMTEAWAYASQLEVRWGGTLTTTNTAAWSGAKSTIGVNKGKWYWEIRWNDTISTYTGIQTQGEDNISASGSAAHSRNTSLSIGAGSKYRTYINGTDTLYTSQPSGNISTGEVTGFALDLDSGTKTLKLIRSGSVVQTYTLTDSLATEYVFPFCSTYAQTLVWNLGGFFHYTLSSAETDANGLGSFEFSPTIGGVNYYALCTKNLALYG